MNTNLLMAQGPNAPEATGFEPVDATDMVNLTTGDFSYVLPLLSVPSPEGGFPIALSYHGGVAMDQEASWVGLGWNINPGAINRSVNGYPDDWKNTKTSEFFYDEGWEDEYYNLEIGVTFKETIDAGIGISWGSNRSLGGYVSAGAKLTGSNFRISGQLGTNGANASVGYGYGSNNLRFSVGTSGVGAAYGRGTGQGTSIGVSLNYSYSDGFSGGISGRYSYSNSNKMFNSSSVGLGVSLSSSGVSVNGSHSGTSIGFNNSSGSVNSGDYTIQHDNDWLTIPGFFFYINASHQTIKYSLNKYKEISTSGALYPYHSNKTKDDNSSYLLFENTSMDSNVISILDDNASINELFLSNYNSDKNNLVFPSYDYYSVNAQGLSGTMVPSSFRELNISTRGIAETNNDDTYVAYAGNPYSTTDSFFDLNGYTNFRFSSMYSSFLRQERGDFYQYIQTTTASEQAALQAFKSDLTNTYSQTTLPSGESLMSINNIRQGALIRVFTNNQIANTNLGFFIEAENLDRSNTKMYPPDAIGAYQITAPDGKVYHYSLPVMHFESQYKNYKNETDEDENFLQIKKNEPYATHWLLTAITGPDYVDVSSYGILDDKDYGYWVSLDYGKWSDGFAWKSSPNFDRNTETYSYSEGRKQIYYLDAIKTRTHTAYFIKDLRLDSQSEEIEQFSSRFNYNSANNFDRNLNSNSYQTVNRELMPAGVLYDENGDSYNWEESANYGNSPLRLMGWRKNYEYKDYPKNYLLKLKQIILVKNSDAILTKTNASLISRTKGAFYGEMSFFWPTYIDYNGTSYVQNTGYWFDEPNILPIIFEGQFADRVIDINDLNNSSIEEKALQIIKFETDYSLAKNSPRSSGSGAGKLTLNKVNIFGKGGTAFVPPYSFSYNSTSTLYDEDAKDSWGYHTSNPDAWSLSSIDIPSGGQLNIEYEPDDYVKEASNPSRIFNYGLKFELTKVSSNLVFEISESNHTNAKSLEDFNTFRDYFELGSSTNLDFFICRKTKYGGDRREVNLKLLFEDCQVIYLDDDKIKLSIPDNSNFWYYDDQNQNWILNRTWSLTDVINANGSQDGVILRQTQRDECYKWRSSYVNDDVSINYQLASTRTPQNVAEGGLRVKSLIVQDQANSIKTDYFYNNTVTNKRYNDVGYITSGITSYAPSEYSKVIPYASEMPGPAIIYSTVKVSTSGSNNNFMGQTLYEFETLQDISQSSGNLSPLGDYLKVTEDQNQSFLGNDIKVKRFTVANKRRNLGRIKRMKQFNSAQQIISKQEQKYRENLDDNGELGVIQQTYKTVKKVKVDDDISYFITGSSRIDYPSVNEYSTYIGNGIIQTSSVDKFDFLTGQPLISTSISSDGTKFKSEVVPAYKIPQYNSSSGHSMGSKVDNITNRNMLTQEAASLSFMIDGSGNEKLIGANITTWNNNWDYFDYDGSDETPSSDPKRQIWRKHRNYTWKGSLNTDGSYNGYSGDYDGFNWNVGVNQSSGSQWQMVGETSYYDHYSMPVENKDINGNYASTKMDRNDEKVFSVSNSSYNEQFYSGAEDDEKNGYYGGGVRHYNPTFKTSHTGDRAESATTSSKTFRVVPRAKFQPGQTSKKFKVSVWVSIGDESKARIKTPESGSLQTFSTQERVYAGKWVQLNHYFDITTITNNQEVYVRSSSGTIYFDDFRLHPVQSTMTSYVYNDWDELTYVLGGNNMGTKYEYDDAGRLKRTYVEVANASGLTGGFKKSAEFNQNYKRAISTGNDTNNGLAVYFDFINENETSERSTATLFGPVGSNVRLSLAVNGANSNMSGLVTGYDSIDNGIYLVQIPSSGQKELTVRFDPSNTNTCNDCGGFAVLNIEDVDLGIVTPNGDGTATSFTDRDLEHCCNYNVTPSCSACVPPPPPEVSINFLTINSQYLSNGNRSYTANASGVSGGTPGYTFKWFRKIGSGSETYLGSSGSTPSYTFNSTTCNGSFTIRCEVRDSETPAGFDDRTSGPYPFNCTSNEN